MKSLKTQKLSTYLIISLILTSFISQAQTPYQPKEIVQGGQFKDLILPMPIVKKLTDKKIWGVDAVLPRDVDNGIEANDWCYWGGNPMLGEDGKYHITIARWPEETGHWGWPKSEVAHAVSKNPMGPYKITGTALPKAHNPEVVRLNDGSYILHISGGQIYTSQSLEGHWELLGKIEIDTRGFRGLSHLYTNLTGLQRADGSFMFFTKRGDVMISNTGLLGPYKIVSSRNYDRYTGYPEDPVIWKSRHQYHVVFNHAVDKKSVYMRSLDGINWKIEPGEPYDKTVFRYTDGTVNTWTKFERPKVQQDEYGRATYLSLAVIDVEKKEDLGNDSHSSKHIILPLALERLVEIVNPETITSATKEITIRIKAEKGYDPVEDINVESLRLGTSEIVNYGGGVKPISSKEIDGDLEVTFQWDGTNLNSSIYDLKVLGKSKNNEIVYGYALLPQFTTDPASLVTLPVKVQDNKLVSKVENYGLKNSDPCVVRVFKIFNNERIELKQFDIPSLKPYEGYDIKFPVDNSEGAEYEVLVANANEEPRFWNKVDDNHYSIMYKGNWNKNTNGKDIYQGSEQVSADEGASATFFFSGTQARCYGHISRKMGSYNVYIDDNFIEKVDCFFGADLHNMIIYQTEVLPAGLHKLELRATGKHYKGNPEGPVSIDGFSFIK